MAQLDPIPLAWQRAILRKEVSMREVSMREVWWIIALVAEAEQEGKKRATMPPELLPACQALGLVARDG